MECDRNNRICKTPFKLENLYWCLTNPQFIRIQPLHIHFFPRNISLAKLDSNLFPLLLAAESQA